MKYRRLGRTGIQVSEIGLGGNTFGNPCDASTTKAIVHRALDLGINFIDTADIYANGASEEYLGRAIAQRRQEVIIATKTGWPDSATDSVGRLTRQRIIARLEASLRRLGTDHVDVYYFHHPDPSTPIEESLRAIEDMVRAGKVRYLGFSNYVASRAAEIVAVCRSEGYSMPVVSQSPYNLLNRTIEAKLVPTCALLGISVVAYEPLAGGFLTGKYRSGKDPDPAEMRFGRNPTRWDLAQSKRYLTHDGFEKVEHYRAFASARGHSMAELALSWLLAHPIVCSVIPAATSAGQVEANTRAAEWMLSRRDLYELV